MDFSSFGFADRLLKNIRTLGLEVTAPVHELVFPVAAEGKNIVVRADAGTPRTTAYVLAAYNRVLQSHGEEQTDHYPQALILTPNRVGVQQVVDAALVAARGTELRVISVIGGASMEKQLELLERGSDVVVATPGRLLDHIRRGSVNLSRINVFVVDEAERLSEPGFQRDMREIVPLLPAGRQTMVFSSTPYDRIAPFVADLLVEPVVLDAGAPALNGGSFVEGFYAATRDSKMGMLVHTVESRAPGRVVVYSATDHDVDRIWRRFMQRNVGVVSVHAGRTPEQCERALESFKSGKFRVLVTTGGASKAADVIGNAHVVNYDMPREESEYRERRGVEGGPKPMSVTTFVEPEERSAAEKFEAIVGHAVKVEAYPARIDQDRRHGIVHAVPARTGMQRPGVKKSHGPALKVKKKKRPSILAVRRRKPAKKMDSFSSDHGGAGWGY